MIVLSASKVIPLVVAKVKVADVCKVPPLKVNRFATAVGVGATPRLLSALILIVPALILIIPE